MCVIVMFGTNIILRVLVEYLLRRLCRDVVILQKRFFRDQECIESVEIIRETELHLEFTVNMGISESVQHAIDFVCRYNVKLFFIC